MLILKKLGTLVGRVVVVGFSRPLRDFLLVLRFSSLRKINTCDPWIVVVWRLPKASLICLRLDHFDLRPL